MIKSDTIFISSKVKLAPSNKHRVLFPRKCIVKRLDIVLIGEYALQEADRARMVHLSLRHTLLNLLLKSPRIQGFHSRLFNCRQLFLVAGWGETHTWELLEGRFAQFSLVVAGP